VQQHLAADAGGAASTIGRRPVGEGVGLIPDGTVSKGNKGNIGIEALGVHPWSFCSTPSLGVLSRCPGVTHPMLSPSPSQRSCPAWMDARHNSGWTVSRLIGMNRFRAHARLCMLPGKAMLVAKGARRGSELSGSAFRRRCDQSPLETWPVPERVLGSGRESSRDQGRPACCAIGGTGPDCGDRQAEFLHAES
jgi:hypothetical protein